MSAEKLAGLKKIPKAEMIVQVITLFHKLGQSRMHYQFEPWRKLDVPLAQLKSLFLIHIRGHMKRILERMSAADIAALIRGMSSIIAAIEQDREKPVAKRSKDSRNADI